MADAGICTQAVKDAPIMPRSCRTNDMGSMQTTAGRTEQVKETWHSFTFRHSTLSPPGGFACWFARAS
jgi:hypothetical protein